MSRPVFVRGGRRTTPALIALRIFFIAQARQQSSGGFLRRSPAGMQPGRISAVRIRLRNAYQCDEQSINNIDREYRKTFALAAFSIGLWYCLQSASITISKLNHHFFI